MENILVELNEDQVDNVTGAICISWRNIYICVPDFHLF